MTPHALPALAHVRPVQTAERCISLDADRSWLSRPQRCLGIDPVFLSTSGCKAPGSPADGLPQRIAEHVLPCHEVVHAMGAVRISTVVKLGTRTDRDQTMEDKIRSVESKL